VDAAQVAGAVVEQSDHACKDYDAKGAPSTFALGAAFAFPPLPCDSLLPAGGLTKAEHFLNQENVQFVFVAVDETFAFADSFQ